MRGPQPQPTQLPPAPTGDRRPVGPRSAQTARSARSATVLRLLGSSLLLAVATAWSVPARPDQDTSPATAPSGSAAGPAASAADNSRPRTGGRSGAVVRAPWREAGLTERQAAAHLLDRLSYGARPGEVERVAAMGVGRWLERQLAADLPEPALTAALARYDALGMSTDELAETFVPPAVIVREAQRSGVLPANMDPRTLGERGGAEAARLRYALVRFARERGYRRQRELLGQLMAQKLTRAVSAENQLAELLTGFWFNHFNVSITDNETRPWVLAYERDAIRPQALGDFRSLLGATARHPAMLLYLDNARSVAAEGMPTTAGERIDRLRGRRGGFGPPGRRGRGGAAGGRLPDRGAMADDPEMEELRRRNRSTGLNENYARELLELHTLGVDGGYGQADVVEVARAFSGWTVVPPGPARSEVEARLARVEGIGDRFGGLGFVLGDDGFLFRADAHDAGPKTVLGRRLAAGRGLEDGEEVLDLVAAHPATARHLAGKLATRFVSDRPPAALVERLAARWTATGGDLGAVMRALVESPEFWGPEARAAKIKSPLELAASALRGLDAELGDPRATLEWIGRMGEPLYAYQAPTGYPDRAEAWVNTGSLLNRMNFGLQLAAGRVPGVRFDLAALTGGREPPSREEALATYAALLMPERDLATALARLEEVVRDPELARKVDEAAPPGEAPRLAADESELFGDEEGGGGAENGMADGMAAEGAAAGPTLPADGDSDGESYGRRHRGDLAGRPELRQRYPAPTPLEQVVGVILGSPAFQRR